MPQFLQVDAESLLRPPLMHQRQKPDEAAALAVHLPDPRLNLLLDIQDRRNGCNMLLQRFLLGLFANRGLIRRSAPHSNTAHRTHARLLSASSLASTLFFTLSSSSACLFATVRRRLFRLRWS